MSVVSSLLVFLIMSLGILLLFGFIYLAAISAEVLIFFVIVIALFFFLKQFI